MGYKSFCIIICIIFLHIAAHGQHTKSITLNWNDLVTLKQQTEMDKRLSSAKRDLILKSNQILSTKKLYSVTYNSSVRLDAKRNDYSSNSSYLWPNPDTKDGLPYIVIDGKVNRYSEKMSDKPMIDGLSSDITHLGLAYFYTKDEKYVEWASSLLDHFFVNPDTRMNPNFNFSQVAPGKYNSGGSIMEAVVFINLIEGIQFMRSSKSFPTKLDNNLIQWFNEFDDWIVNSPKGKVNATYKNNRGTYYTLLRCSIAMFTRNEDRASEIFRKEAFQRVVDQISPEGVLEQELKRVRPLGYIKFNLSAFRQLNEIGKSLGFDLINYEGSRGQSLKKAFEWLKNYGVGKSSWTYSQEAGLSHYRKRKMKKGEEAILRFRVERFDNYLEDLTIIDDGLKLRLNYREQHTRLN